jgi:thiol:disulfide interchange protein DsbD
MTRTIPILVFVAVALTGDPALAQLDSGLDVKPADWQPKRFSDVADVALTVDPPQARRGETVQVKLTITPKNDGYTYPTLPATGQTSKNSIILPPPGAIVFVGSATDPAGKVKPGSDGKEVYCPDPVSWVFKAVVAPEAPLGPITVGLGPKTSFQACREKCFNMPGFGAPPLPTAKLEIVDGPAAKERSNPADLEAAVAILSKKQSSPPATIPAPTPSPGLVKAVASSQEPKEPVSEGHGRKVAKSLSDYEDGLELVRGRLLATEGMADIGTTSKETGLGSFLATAALWGLISLVTPCVFPMIPITVSIFLKQAHGSMGERLKLAGVYCATIITVLGFSAFALLKFMAWLSAHPVTNLLLGGLFLVLALSLFGMYELTLPNFMVRRLQAKQAKGGMIGTMFGALAFTVISFTCVAPFLGGFAGISSADAGGSLIAVPTAREVFGGLAFATAFAAPFFVLALVPGLLKALPRSGGWLDSVKVVMGFLELAAALKFLRTAELRLLPTPAYFTYDVVLTGWVAISAACGLYLLNLYRLPHDEERPNIGVPRLLFAVLFLGFGLYLLPATFKAADGKPQRPAGAAYAWVEAFLLPESDKDWGTDLKEAADRARASNKPVFLDFTGVTCTNCKYNEQSIFTRPEVKEELKQFEGVQLYTDEVPASSYSSDPGPQARALEGQANRDFQVAAFRDSALPLYAVLMPRANGRVEILGVYPEGKINAPEKFVQYLRAMREKAGR